MAGNGSIRDKFMRTWIPRIGERAARQQYRAQWILSVGALTVLAWIVIAILGQVAHSSILDDLSVFLEVVSLILVAVGLVLFLVSRRSRMRS